jgi:hypothetical protein
MNKRLQDISVVVATAVTAVLTAVVLAYVERAFNVALYSYMLWFIIPAGAILAGLVAASGCYIAARLLNHRPTRFVLIGVLAVSAMTFFLINYLDYASLMVDRLPARDAIPFTTYLAISLSDMSMSLCLHATCTGGLSLGPVGYLVAAVQIVGFFLGGAVVYTYLHFVGYCEACSRYLAFRQARSRYFVDVQEATHQYAEVTGLLHQRRYSEALARQASSGTEKPQKNSVVATVVRLKYCKSCLRHQISFFLKQRQKNEWKEIDKSRATVTTVEHFEPAPA